jgi:RNase P protein component
MDGLLPTLAPGKDLILIARSAITTASFGEIQTTLEKLVKRAGLKQDNEDGHDRP